MRNRMYGGVRGRKTKVGRKLLRFPPTRLVYVSYLGKEEDCGHPIIKLNVTFFEEKANQSRRNGKGGLFRMVTFF